jgi:hypothetical protein
LSGFISRGNQKVMKQRVKRALATTKHCIYSHKP